MAKATLSPYGFANGKNNANETQVAAGLRRGAALVSLKDCS